MSCTIRTAPGPTGRGARPRCAGLALPLRALLALFVLFPASLSAQEAGEEPPGSAGVPHYGLGAKIEPSTGRIDVELTMRWAPEAPADTLTFLLHRDLGRPEIESDAVESVRVEPARRFMKAFDSDTSYTNRVTVALARTATPEDPVELRWTYGGELRNEHIRLGASLLTEGWVELQIGSVWVPVAASLREPVTYEARVALPEGFDLVTGGAARRGEDGAYRISREVPHLDVPVIASDRMRAERAGGDGPPVTVYHAGAPDSLVSFVADRTSRILALYDEWLRSGRTLESLRVVIPPVPRARPNAYARPGLISLAHGQEAGADVFDFLSHEAAHLWWSDAADSQSRHNFLNESFAEYTSFLAYREFYGDSAFEKLVERARRESEELPAIRDWSGEFNHPLMYRKGPWLLHRLHERVGEETFLAFLRRLQRESVGTLAGMIRALEATTDAETAAWFDGMLSS